MATDEGLRYIDSDGHILEHPTAMPEYAPAQYRDRIWHIETDEAGEEWLVYDNHRSPANTMSAAGVAGASDEDRARAFRGEMRYTETRPAAWNAKARLQDMDQDSIDLAVLYPTMLLGLQSETDIDFAEAQARAYNDWCSDHVQEGKVGCSAPARCRRCTSPTTCRGWRRRSAGWPSCRAWCRCSCARTRRSTGDRSTTPSTTRSGRPRPTPVCRSRCTRSSPPTSRARASACASPGPAIPTGATPTASTRTARSTRRSSSTTPNRGRARLFTQAIANPVDVMSCIAYLLAGGVCERFPDAKFIFLEANGGWLVPWLERLDHHCRKFQWEVSDLSMLPSEYMRRQCWISFDPDEAMLRITAESPLVGADRIIWASDYPHPDAKFPGVTEELAEALDGLTFEQKREITSESAIALYGIG